MSSHVFLGASRVFLRLIYFSLSTPLAFFFSPVIPASTLLLCLSRSSWMPSWFIFGAHSTKLGHCLLPLSPGAAPGLEAAKLAHQPRGRPFYKGSFFKRQKLFLSSSAKAQISAALQCFLYPCLLWYDDAMYMIFFTGRTEAGGFRPRARVWHSRAKLHSRGVSFFL